jgi:hypothetical protein
MPEVGAFLSSEEHGGPALVRQAKMAEAAHMGGSSSRITSTLGSTHKARVLSCGV